MSNPNMVAGPSPELNQVMDVLTGYQAVLYKANKRTGVRARHMYQFDENDNKRHISRSQAHQEIEQSIADAYGTDFDTASDQLLADYGYVPEPAKSKTLATVTPIGHARPNRPLVAAGRQPQVNAAPQPQTANKVTAPVYNIPTFRDRVRGGLEKLSHRRGVAAATVGVIAVASLLGLSSKMDNAEAAPRVNTEQSSSSTTQKTSSTTERSTTTTEAPTTTTTTVAPFRFPTRSELKMDYTNKITGDRAHDEIGLFNIDPSNPDQSIQDFYDQFRRNPDAAAAMDACLKTGAPSYETCVADLNTLNAADETAVKLRDDNEIVAKALIAENLINQFKQAKFKGITIESGEYKTVGIDKNGKFYATTNFRTNDPRLNWEFNINGKTFNLQIRGCDQITESLKSTPKPVEKPVKKPVQKPVTTTTTVPKTTTTTVPKTTTTTVPRTTTTTVRRTTTTTAPTTTTTGGIVTTTTNTTAKTVVSPPAGEVTTTVVLDPETPANPTTSTVKQNPTSSTATPRTSETTVAPEKPRQDHTPNRDFVFPLGGLGIAGMFAGAEDYRKRVAYVRRNKDTGEIKVDLR